MKALEMMTFGPGGWRVMPEPCAMSVAAWRVVIVIVRGLPLVGSSGPEGWSSPLFTQTYPFWGSATQS